MHELFYFGKVTTLESVFISYSCTSKGYNNISRPPTTPTLKSGGVVTPPTPRIDAYVSPLTPSTLSQLFISLSPSPSILLLHPSSPLPLHPSSPLAWHATLLPLSHSLSPSLLVSLSLVLSLPLSLSISISSTCLPP